MKNTDGITTTQENNPWTYNGKVISSQEDIPKDAIGFVYQISHSSGWKYIGKKNIFSNRTLPPLKGSKRKRKVTKPSDWLKYYSSNTSIHKWREQCGDIGIQREILRFCYSAKQLTYYENKYLYCLGVLEHDIYLNDNISGKIFKGQI